MDEIIKDIERMKCKFRPGQNAICEFWKRKEDYTEEEIEKGEVPYDIKIAEVENVRGVYNTAGGDLWVARNKDTGDIIFDQRDLPLCEIEKRKEGHILINCREE